MIFELYPWNLPVVLALTTAKLPKDEPLKPKQLELVATTLHNAGIYNGVLAGCLCWAAFRGPDVVETAHVLLIGVAVAGTFGAVTLKNPVPAIQALVGVVGFFLL